jgi:hypothetical protein
MTIKAITIKIIDFFIFVLSLLSQQGDFFSLLSCSVFFGLCVAVLLIRPAFYPLPCAVVALCVPLSMVIV